MSDATVSVETIKIPSRKDERLAFIAQSQRQGVEIARTRSERTKQNRMKYGRSKK